MISSTSFRSHTRIVRTLASTQTCCILFERTSCPSWDSFFSSTATRSSAKFRLRSRPTTPSCMTCISALIQPSQLLTLLSSSGFTSLNQFKVELPVDYNTLLQRIEQLCSFFKKVRDQLSAKRKPDKALKDEIQKKIRTSATELTLPC